MRSAVVVPSGARPASGVTDDRRRVQGAWSSVWGPCRRFLPSWNVSEEPSPQSTETSHGPAKGSASAKEPSATLAGVRAVTDCGDGAVTTGELDWTRKS